MGDGIIRAARPEEGALLSQLALRSKAHWGYEPQFVEDCRGELTLDPEYIAAHPVYVSAEGGRVVGFYSLVEKGEGAIDLNHLYVEPSHIGRGHGRRLFLHAAG